MEHIQYLSLSNNRIATWGDLDALNMWCPQLQSLALVGNPLTDSKVGHLRIGVYADMVLQITYNLANRDSSLLHLFPL